MIYNWFKECCEVERKALGAFVNDGSYYPLHKNTINCSIIDNIALTVGLFELVGI